jgi:hypothetical protein
MDERRGLQRLAAVLARNPGSRHAPKFVINQWQELFRGE